MPILTFAGACGAGKSTIRKLLHERLPHHVTSLPTYTTRARRERDTFEHEDIQFISEEDFQQRIASNDFAWHINAHGAWYGTRREDIKEAMYGPKISIANLVPESTPLLRNEMKSIAGNNDIDTMVLHLYLLEPSNESTWHKRLVDRGETPAEIDQRILTSKRWREMVESSDIPYYYIKDIDGDIEGKYQEICKLIKKQGYLI